MKAKKLTKFCGFCDKHGFDYPKSHNEKNCRNICSGCKKAGRPYAHQGKDKV